MDIKELNKKIKNSGISEDKYYLHGLYGSKDDNDKLSLIIKQGKYTIEYEIYFREKGEKHSIEIFTNENEACQYFYDKLKDSLIYENIQKINGLDEMTVNERLYASGLKDEFDMTRNQNKERAKTILRWLRVDEQSIDKTLLKDLNGK